MTELRYGEKAIVTAVRLSFAARKKLLTFGVGLGTLVKLDYNPGYSSLLNVNIQGKSVCIRKQDALCIEVIKYDNV